MRQEQVARERVERRADRSARRINEPVNTDPDSRGRRDSEVGRRTPRTADFWRRYTAA